MIKTVCATTGVPRSIFSNIHSSFGFQLGIIYQDFHDFSDILAKQRKTDAEVEELFGSDRIKIKTGKAGTALLGNTGSLHKGMLPKTGKRLMFLALYTMLPTIKDVVSRTPLAFLRNEIHEAYPGVYTNDQIAYLNRLVAI